LFKHIDTKYIFEFVKSASATLSAT